MDSMSSFKGYGKVDELEEQAFRAKTRKRYIIITVSVVVLLAVIIGAVTGTVIHNRNNNSSSPSPNTEPVTQLTPSASLKAVCDVTLYPSSCFSSISSLKNSNTTDPEALFKLSLHVAIDEVSKLKDLPSLINTKIGNDTKLIKAMNVCESLFDDAVDKLNDSLSAMEVSPGEKLLSQAKINDLKTWITATMTDHETCLDTIEDLNSTLVQDFRDAMQNSTQYASNSLAIVAKILALLTNLNIPVHRRLLGYRETKSFSSSVPELFPGWVSPGDRRLLQEQNLTAHVTVAQDGTGDFKTIQEAVNAVPKKNLTRFVIYLKAGTYLENVQMDKSVWNVMIYGDGKTKTIVSGSKNFGVDKTPTFLTATFAVQGRGFIARDIGFINTAGPEKHQAVAFRSGSDQSVYYRCSFDAFQDTLYAHSNRQFYRDCDIVGTIDFIFGNAAVVFQDCNIQPRQPMPNQFNTITAQGKKDPNQNSGISIQKCTISPYKNNVTAPTYLGRPWKNFSTTVIMQSTIGSFLNSSGWIEWFPNVDPPATIFYAEYQNSGPGSSVDKRVTWNGYRSSLTDTEAARFTVESFIQGSEWLPQTSVNFDGSL